MIAVVATVVLAFLYAVYYFNYFETPTGDYIGNILPRVQEYLRGEFPGRIYKFLPLYPLLLTLMAGTLPLNVEDPIYYSAMLLNIALFVPYLVVVYRLYRIFLNRWLSAAALCFLAVNMYTIYTAVNSELEMVLSLLCVLTVYLSLIDSRLSYASAFLAAITKWDAVFTIPAAMFRDFFVRRKRLLAIVMGICATSGVALWMLASKLLSAGSHPYVAEIAQRGPNIYRYLFDCFLVTGGFIQWAATEGYYSTSIPHAVAQYSLAFLFGIAILLCTCWGAIIFVKTRRREGAPLLVFFGGFMLIHMVYQNTKDRYVLPILWLLMMFLVIGISEGFYPRIRRYLSEHAPSRLNLYRYILIPLFAIIFLWSIIKLVHTSSVGLVVFAALFIIISGYILISSRVFPSKASAALAMFMVAAFIGLQVAYGMRLMDHHSLSRVEFKRAALWYREHFREGDKMLMSEINVPMYYSKFSRSRFVETFAVNSRNLEQLIDECREKGITYVFVDDYYIRRLKVNDQNAIDRKARLMRELRESGERSGHFVLMHRFKTKGDIVSSIYQFKP